MNPDLAQHDAAARHRRLPSCRLLVALTMFALASACSSAPPTPAAPASPATVSAAPATVSAAPATTPAERRLPAIESSAPVAPRDDTSSLKDAAVPFAAYLVAMHSRIRPIFAEEMAALDKRPHAQALDGDLVTRLEIVIDRSTGKLVRIGVVKSSGLTAFDVAALSSIDRAAPFDPAPEIIASPDGNVYVHWELHRDPRIACDTRNATPFLLKSRP